MTVIGLVAQQVFITKVTFKSDLVSRKFSKDLFTFQPQVSQTLNMLEFRICDNQFICFIVYMFCFISVAVTNSFVKSNLGGKQFIWLTIPYHSSSLKGSPGRNSSSKPHHIHSQEWREMSVPTLLALSLLLSSSLLSYIVQILLPRE